MFLLHGFMRRLAIEDFNILIYGKDHFPTFETPGKKDHANA